MQQEYIDRVWSENPHYMRRYYELLPMHERLCAEVEYILKTLLKSEQIEIAHTTKRAKKVSSFCEKIFRKTYSDPFSEITDFAGVRIVYLYMSDLEKIEKIIEREFEVIERENKFETKDVEKFGYGALHYIIKIKEEQTGARYHDLMNLVCEIQVRTILQDAWAIVAHHLSYKQETDVPRVIRRKLYALSGLFETADDQFEGLKIAIDDYTEQFQKSLDVSKSEQLEEELNLDNLTAYLSATFPGRKVSPREQVSEVLTELKNYGYNTLVSVENVINSTINAVLADEEKYPPVDDDEGVTKYATVGVVRTALSYFDRKYCEERYGEHTQKKQEEFEHLVNKNA